MTKFMTILNLIVHILNVNLDLTDVGGTVITGHPHLSLEKAAVFPSNTTFA